MPFCSDCFIPIQPPKRRYCSTRCKNRRKTREWQTKNAKIRRLALVNLRGGKCAHCGYAKNLAALSFHHLDDTKKSFQIDMRAVSNTNWETLKLEVAKCQILCANCHMEEHYPHLQLPL